MNAPLPLFVSTLGWALIHFLWQGALVGVAAAIALMLLRNARPQARYVVSCAALALCLALPMAGVWRGMHVDAAVEMSPITEALQYVSVSGQTIAPPLVSWRSDLQGQLPWIVMLWSIGAGLLALRMAIGMMWVDRISHSRSVTSDPHWQAQLDRLATMLGIQGDIRLHVVADLDSPVAAGWWRPMVLVPTMLLTRMSPDLLEALLAHELAHIKRQDYLVNLLQSAVEALLFYHPVVWWLSRQIRIEREQIADDLAVTALGEPRRLALALHELDQFQLGNSSSLAARLVPAATGGNLMSRIQRLIRPSQHALNWKMSLPIIGLTAFCLTVYAHGVAPAATGPMLAATTAAVTSTTSDEHATTRIYQASDHEENGYAVIRAGQDGMTMSGDSRDIPVIEKAKAQVHGDFVWVRRGSKTYVVQDPGVIAQVVEARKPADALDAQMEALDAKMEEPNKQMEALSQQMEALENKNHPNNEVMEKTSTQMEALGKQQEAIGAKMETLDRQREHAKLSESESDAIDQQMETLQAQMEPLNQQMEQLNAVMEQQSKAMEAAQKPVEDLSRQMEEASKPVEALGKQMEVLGKQMEQLGHEADQKTNALIDDALRNGKAVPLDAVVR